MNQSRNVGRGFSIANIERKQTERFDLHSIDKFFANNGHENVTKGINFSRQV